MKKRIKKIKEFNFIKDRKLGKKIFNKMLSNFNGTSDYKLEDEKIMFKEGKRFIAVDDSTGDCWTEEFKNYKQAKKYLLGDDTVIMSPKKRIKRSKKKRNYKKKKTLF